MKTLLTFFVLLCIKAAAKVFYSIEMSWIGGMTTFKGTRLIVLLNHTSLFEPIYLSVLPASLLWKIATTGILPGADITMSRPIVGWFFRLVSSSTVPISRRRDKTWSAFLERVRRDSIILIAAEGRMKRSNGLDKNGNPMTVRGGVSDLLERVNDGKMAIAYELDSFAVRV
ncbi:MAG: 1-acyl-sn-glycerol-3-phosphate acyltransferase [Deltaproteobacteria bacterium]|nr:1-acyl-sn-glycerol-3-phosphate acyltransferase [Deltaproteobacteria bacterium]